MLDNKPILVLCVDDDPLMRDITSDMLEGLGHDVISTSDPRAALAELDRTGRKIDILLTDVRMPEMSGYALAHRARSARPTLPVIFMSGDGGFETAPGLLLTKPCTLGQLDRAITNAVR